MSEEIQENLFDLTEEQVSQSKSMYNGKVIKCLVTPYHSKAELSTKIPYTPTTYLFPETEMSYNQAKKFISMIVNNNPNATDEVRIITSSQSIILDMIDGCVRILTEDNSVVDCPSKTFMANIHDIRHNVLENSIHQKSEKEESIGVSSINAIISTLNEHIDQGSKMDKNDYDRISNQIKMIGEPLIKDSVSNMLSLVEKV